MLSFLRQFPNFRTLWLGQVVSQLGDRVHTLAVIWLVYDWTRSGTALGMVLIAATLPSVMVAPFAGFVSDRFDRKTVLIVSDLLRCIPTLALAALAASGTLDIRLLVVFTAIISLLSAFFNPAAMSLLPAIVPGDQLSRANAITQLSVNASGALGFLAGSGLIALIGVPAAFLGNALSFILSALLIGRVRVGRQAAPSAFAFFSDLAQGWAAIKALPMVHRLLAPLVVINLFFASLTVLIPIFGEGLFHAGSAGIGILLASFTAGMFLAALVLSSWRPDMSVARLVVTGLLLQSLCFAGMGLITWLPLFIIALALTGLALSMVNICLISFLQRVVPPQVQGKFFSLLTAVSLSSQPLAYGLTGWLSDAISPRTLITVSGVALALCAFMIHRIRELRIQHV
ncbi:MAG: MFS transporter [Ottowia sp.]|nr:MFS transporter [Ottowia sp.]